MRAIESGNDELVLAICSHFRWDLGFVINDQSTLADVLLRQGRIDLVKEMMHSQNVSLPDVLTLDRLFVTVGILFQSDRVDILSFIADHGVSFDLASLTNMIVFAVRNAHLQENLARILELPLSIDWHAVMTRPLRN